MLKYSLDIETALKPLEHCELGDAKIVVISDTHERKLAKLSPKVLQAVGEADVVVHCGDYVGLEVLEGLAGLAKKFVGVYGNTDPNEVRRILPSKIVFEFEGKRIGVTHPHCGGPPLELEEIAHQFGDVDVILFGHTHETCNTKLDNRLLLNPGQAYSSFMVPATLGILRINERGIEGEIITLG